MTFSERAVEAKLAQTICRSDDGPGVPSCVMDAHPERDPCDDKNCRRFAQARAVLAALAVDGLALQGWRTIDSAPKDGTEVLLWFPFTPDKPHWSHPTGFVFLAKWWISDGIDEDRWVDPDDCEDLGSTPTHWQPLPAPPLTAASDGEVG